MVKSCRGLEFSRNWAKMYSEIAFVNATLSRIIVCQYLPHNNNIYQELFEIKCSILWHLETNICLSTYYCITANPVSWNLTVRLHWTFLAHDSWPWLDNSDRLFVDWVSQPIGDRSFPVTVMRRALKKLIYPFTLTQWTLTENYSCKHIYSFNLIQNIFIQ